MFSKGSLLFGAALLTMLLVPGCDDTPTGPSSLPDITQSRPPAATQVIGTWQVTMRTTELSGEGKQCVIDSLRKEMNTHNQYRLSIVQHDDRSEATLTSAADDFACTWPVKVDSTGFTEAPGYYSCARQEKLVTCDGTQHALITLGQTISARFSGNDVSGVWSAFWVDRIDDEEGLEMKAQLAGTK